MSTKPLSVGFESRPTLILNQNTYLKMNILRGVTGQLFMRATGLNFSITDAIEKGWKTVSHAFPYFGAEAKGLDFSEFEAFTEAVPTPVPAATVNDTSVFTQAINTMNQWKETIEAWMPEPIKCSADAACKFKSHVWSVVSDNSDWIVPTVAFSIIFGAANCLLSKKVESGHKRNLLSFTASIVSVWAMSQLLTQVGMNHTITLNKVIDIGTQIAVFSMAAKVATPFAQRALSYFNHEILSLFYAPFAFQPNKLKIQ